MKKVLLFVLAIIPLLIFVGVRRNSAPFFSVQAHQCVVAEFLSEDYCSSISSSLAEMLNQKCAAHELIAQLKKQFPVLNKIVVSYRPSVVHVTMSAHEPICCINDATILTCHNELVPKNFFSTIAIADLPKVMCHVPFDVFSRAHSEPVEELSAQGNPSTSSGRALGDEVNAIKNVSLLISSLLHELPSDVNRAYNLEFMNEHYVRLVDKQEPNFVIALTAAQKKSPMLLAQCESVKKNIAARAGFDKGVKWIADTRFAHYIVAYKT